MKLMSILMALAAICQMANAQEKNLPIRYNSDFSLFFVYLSKSIALEKGQSVDASGNDLTSYAIVKAHWVNEPETEAMTGDWPDADIVSTAKRIGTDKSGNWLLITGENFDEKKTNWVNIASVIFLPTEKVYSADNLEALQSEVKTNQITLNTIKLERMEVFFDRQLVTRLSSKNPSTK